ncbi:MAG: class I SAM-dependent methyltransferase, partial [Oscillospiraceae bacterium]|nr:class I SAM-dependent methyltransferase [Oscillospiraceae bacterium]
SYSVELIEYLKSEIITKHSVIADIGCGTGKFTKQLLEIGNKVYGVEPNHNMLDTAKCELEKFNNFIPVNGSSSATVLIENSIDIITVAQAFHWFDVKEFYRECKRILKPNGYIILIWNTRDLSDTLNKDSYKIFEKYCPEFKGFSGGMTEDDIRIKDFFNNRYKKLCFENPIVYTKETFIKRCLSASYSLTVNDNRFMEYIEELDKLFEKYSVSGTLIMKNYTIAYIGTL